MSSNNANRKIVSVGEQAFEQADEQAVDEDGFPVVDETPEFEATVDQKTQAKVDANYPDGKQHCRVCRPLVWALGTAGLL